MEETRTNYFTYSSQFDNAAWTKFNCSILPNSAIAPDGTLTAQGIVESNDVSVAFHTLPRTISGLTTGTYYTMSAYVSTSTNAPTVTSFEISPMSGSGSNWNLSTKTLNFSYGSATNPTITDIGNGWTRISTTVLVTATSVNATFVTSLGSNTNHTGTGALTTFIWGAQYEAGAFPTSLIPTTSAQATRTTELASISGQNFSSWYNSTQGTLYWEGDSIENNESTYYRWPVSLGSGSPGAKIGFFKTIGTQIMYAIFRDAGVITIFTPTVNNNRTVDKNSIMKLALSYQTGNQFAVGQSYSGGAVYTSSGSFTSNVIPPTTINSMWIGYGDYYWCGHIRSIVFYPERLANTLTQSLTSI